MTTFSDLLTSNDEIIAGKAQDLKDIKAQRDAGLLTAKEAAELTGDLLTLDDVEGITDDVNRISAITEALKIMVYVASTVFKLI